MENIEETNEPEEKTISKRKENLIIFLIVFSIIILAAGSGFWLWQKLKPPSLEKKISIQNLSQDAGSSEDAALEAENKAKEEEKAALQETKTVKTGDIDIKVLNGGAAAGSAGIVKGILASKDYVKVDTQNAKAISYKGVTVYYLPELKNEAEAIKELLSAKYKNIEIKEGINEKEIKGDIVIIMGK